MWCFYLAVAQLAIDEHESYRWVKYLYIDDPISSLDDNNAIAVASHLAQLLKSTNGNIKVVISTHHALFEAYFNAILYMPREIASTALSGTITFPRNSV